MRRFVASCSVVLIAIALFGACGGSESKTPASPGTNPDATAPDGSGSDLAQRYADMTKQRFKITFNGPDDDSTVYAQDGNGNSVFGAGDSRTFISPSGTVTCSTVSGD